VKGLGKVIIVEVTRGDGLGKLGRAEASSGIPDVPDRGPKKSDLSDIERNLGIGMLFLLPSIAKKLLFLPSILNLFSLRTGECPVGPDLDVDGRWLTEAILTAMKDRVQDWRAS
jgi:hypothetical protein